MVLPIDKGKFLSGAGNVLLGLILIGDINSFGLDSMIDDDDVDMSFGNDLENKSMEFNGDLSKKRLVILIPLIFKKF
jgi:hypothetical protein